MVITFVANTKRYILRDRKCVIRALYLGNNDVFGCGSIDKYIHHGSLSNS